MIPPLSASSVSNSRSIGAVAGTRRTGHEISDSRRTTFQTVSAQTASLILVPGAAAMRDVSPVRGAAAACVPGSRPGAGFPAPDLLAAGRADLAEPEIAQQGGETGAVLSPDPRRDRLQPSCHPADQRGENAV